MTLCYSVSQQPAAPVIAALGKTLRPYEITIDKLSLVIQRGPALSWDWRPTGTIHLGRKQQNLAFLAIPINPPQPSSTAWSRVRSAVR